ncbi:MAG: YggT family protein [Pseudomonadota bacterium]
MGSTYLSNPLVFLVQTLFGFYTVLVLLRFLLQTVRADFYNPLSQFIVKFTSPLLHPLRRIIPGWGGFDWAALVLAWGLKSLELFLVLLLGGHAAGLVIFLWALPELVSLVFNLYLFAVLILVIASWIAPGGYNPGLDLVARLARPLMVVARRILPPISGVDLSPMLVTLAIVMAEMLVMPPLRLWVQSPLFL